MFYGRVTEWFKVTVLKTVVGQLTASSNLALSAKKNTVQMDCIFLDLGLVFELADIILARCTASSVERYLAPANMVK